MTKDEVRKQLKQTAFNAIKKLYHPLYKGFGQNHWDGSICEQRDSMIAGILEQLKRDLVALREKK